jgi:hypothetical protein
LGGGGGASGVVTVGVVTVGVVTVVVGVTGVDGTVVVVLGTVVLGTLTSGTVGTPGSAPTSAAPVTITEHVAKAVSAAIRFRLPMPIEALGTSPRHRLNVHPVDAERAR